MPYLHLVWLCNVYRHCSIYDQKLSIISYIMCFQHLGPSFVTQLNKRLVSFFHQKRADKTKINQYNFMLGSDILMMLKCGSFSLTAIFSLLWSLRFIVFTVYNIP